MNAPINSSPEVAVDLHRLSRTVRKILDLAKEELRKVSQALGKRDNFAVREFLYTHPTVNQYETTLRRRYDEIWYALFPKSEDRELAENKLELFNAFMRDAFAAGEIHHEATVTDKARKAAKRKRLAAKRERIAELGTDLSKVDHATPATYKTLRAGLEPVRISVEARYVVVLNERHVQLKEMIGSDYRVRFSRPSRFKEGTTVELPEDFYFFFTRTGAATPFGVVDHADLANKIKVHAHNRAIAETDAFAAKLAGKIDGSANGAALLRVEVAGSSLWNHSTLTAHLQYDVVQIWATHLIWNVSCLGKTFNQWPTRRVD